MKNRYDIIPILLTLLLLSLTACQQIGDLPQSEEEGKKEVVELEEPIYLSLGVFQSQTPQDAPSSRTLRAAAGELEYQYTDEDKRKATINTLNNFKNDREDAIFSIFIPELNAGDYKLLNPSDYNDKTRATGEAPVIVLYALPAGPNATLSFYANGMKYVGDVPIDYSTKPLSEPLYYEVLHNRPYGYATSSNMSPEVVNPGSYSWGKNKNDGLPMFTKLYNVTEDNMKIKASDTPTGTPAVVEYLYFERAVAKIEISIPWKLYDFFDTNVKPVKLLEIRACNYPALLSWKPNNFAATMEESKKAGGSTTGYVSNDETSWGISGGIEYYGLGKVGSTSFTLYLPENHPASREGVTRLELTLERANLTEAGKAKVAYNNANPMPDNNSFAKPFTAEDFDATNPFTLEKVYIDLGEADATGNKLYKLRRNTLYTGTIQFTQRMHGVGVKLWDTSQRINGDDEIVINPF